MNETYDISSPEIFLILAAILYEYGNETNLLPINHLLDVGRRITEGGDRFGFALGSLPETDGIFIQLLIGDELSSTLEVSWLPLSD